MVKYNVSENGARNIFSNWNMENNFVHLNLHTEYSLSEGVNSIDNFLVRAKELGMNSLAVTDYANMFCAV
ncbi:MAG: PHP domain-containing protein, partial [Dialister invisus]